MDSIYWNKFYNDHSTDDNIVKASSFATFCQQKVFKNEIKNIVDLGCGNGRDSYYLVEQNHTVYGIDQVINESVRQKREHKNLHLIEGDFVYNDYEFEHQPDVFYSRFTMHSIKIEDEQHLLPNVYRSLNKGGLFCIESRTIKDPLSRKGLHCGGNTYFLDGHNRRFLDSQEFVKTVTEVGFKLKYFTEENNLSVIGEDNPVLMRIILEK